MYYRWHKQHPTFKPDFSPSEMFELGVFEGNYFNNKLFKDANKVFYELPKQFLNEVDEDKLRSSSPCVSNNHHLTSCGSSYDNWNDNGWIKEQDPFGWVNWYINFYYGRRSNDDDRQIKRWNQFKSRFSSMLVRHPNSSRIQQSLLHWSIDSELILESQLV